MHRGRYRSRQNRTVGTTVEELLNGEQQEHSEAARLQHGAEQSLSGQPAVQQVFPVSPHPAAKQHVQRGRMRHKNQRQEDPSRGPGALDFIDPIRDTTQAVEVDREQQEVIDVEDRPGEITRGYEYQPSKNRGWVGGVGQPIIRKQSLPGLSQAMQKVLVLIGRCTAAPGRRPGQARHPILQTPARSAGGRVWTWANYHASRALLQGHVGKPKIGASPAGHATSYFNHLLNLGEPNKLVSTT